MKLTVLSNAIKHNDCVIHRKSDECQQSRDHGQANFPLKDREETERYKHVVKYSDDCCSTIRPLKPHCDVQEDSNQGRQRYSNCLVAEFHAGHFTDSIS